MRFEHAAATMALLVTVAAALPPSPEPASGRSAMTGLEPAYQLEETLHFDGAVFGGFAVTGQYEYHAAVRYTPEKPCSVIAVIFYQYDASAEDGRVYIYGPNTRTRPGERLALAFYPGAGTRQWKRVELAEPVSVDSVVDFWTCVTTTHYTGDHPLAVDRGPLERYRGGFIKVPLMGETWYQLTDAPFYENRNWNQRAIVVSVTGIEEELGPVLPPGPASLPRVVRGRLSLPDAGPVVSYSLFDTNGRRVMELRPGTNDVSHLPTDGYVVRQWSSRGQAGAAAARVVILR